MINDNNKVDSSILIKLKLNNKTSMSDINSTIYEFQDFIMKSMTSILLEIVNTNKKSVILTQSLEQEKKAPPQQNNPTLQSTTPLTRTGYNITLTNPYQSQYYNKTIYQMCYNLFIN